MKDQERAGGIVYQDFSMAFHNVSHKTVIDKLLMYRLVKQMVSWIKS